MAALVAHLLGSEIGLAAMARAMHALADLFVDQVLSTPAAPDGDAVHDVSGALLVAGRLGDVALGLLRLLMAMALALLGGVPGALLAPQVATLEAGLVGAVGSVALVAGAVDPHADIFLDPLGVGVGASGKIGRSDIKTMLLEEKLSPLGCI